MSDALREMPAINAEAEITRSLARAARLRQAILKRAFEGNLRWKQVLSTLEFVILMIYNQISLISLRRVASMAILIKRTGSILSSTSGPLSLVAKSIGGDKSVLAIELKPEQRHLGPSLFKAIDMLASIISSRTAELQKDKIERLGELLIEAVELPPAAIVEAEMRADTVKQLIGNGGWLTTAQIAKKGGYSKSNLAAPANRWKKEGKVFAVPFKGQDLFAAYQFDHSMKPRPIIAGVLKLFAGKHDPWKIAAWFGSANGWLRGKRPQDCLDDSAAVLEAAKQEAAGFDG